MIKKSGMLKRVKYWVVAVMGLFASASVQAATKVYYIHSDHLGTPQVMTDAGQTVVWKADYQPFGEAMVHEDPDGDGVAVEMPLRFPGQYFDKETETHYNYYRTYEPSLGRYIQSDRLDILGRTNDPQLLTAREIGAVKWGLPIGLNNMYGYAGCNPINAWDFYGLLSCMEKLRTCRATCRLGNGACLIKCEEEFGALGDCKDDPDDPDDPGEPTDPEEKTPKPDPLTPDCTFEKWKAGKCGQPEPEQCL